VDGTPTPENPYPTLQMGFPQPVIQSRRKLFRHPVPKKRKIDKNEDNVSLPTDPSISSPQPMSTFSPLLSPIWSEHSYFTPHGNIRCEGCVVKSFLVQSLVKKVNSLTSEVKRLKCQKHSLLKGIRNEKKKEKRFSWKQIKTDE
jgi:hypothetical protein